MYGSTLESTELAQARCFLLLYARRTQYEILNFKSFCKCLGQLLTLKHSIDIFQFIR